MHEVMEYLELQAAPADNGRRIDSFVADAASGLTRSAVQRLCTEGLVYAGGIALSKNYRLRGDERIRVMLPPAKPLEAIPQDIPLDIVFEDKALLVVNKPKGMVVHPAPGNDDGTLVNALLYHCAGSLSGIGGVMRPGIVHRIDKDTSGLLVIAKTDQAHLGLSGQVKAHTFTRIYNAVAYGKFREKSGLIDAPIGRHPTDRKRMCVTDRHARDARTHYEVRAQLAEFADVVLRLETGRTHQIRVHLRHIGHPVAGDPVYGPKKVITSLNGQCLHARTLGFVHPVTGAYLEFTSDLPAYYTDFLDKQRQ